MKRYILKAYYTAHDSLRGYRRVLANFVVTNPVVCSDGIWATSGTAWGGETRHFYKASDIVSLEEELK